MIAHALDYLKDVLQVGWPMFLGTATCMAIACLVTDNDEADTDL